MDYSIIKNLFDEPNISFKELSDILNVNRKMYNSPTKGNPTLQRLESVANVLNVPVWRLFTTDNKAEIYGSVLYEDEVYVVRTKQDVINLADIISK